jgi:hypothetical protein
VGYDDGTLDGAEELNGVGIKVGNKHKESSSVMFSVFRTTSRAPDDTLSRIRPPRTPPLITNFDASTESFFVILRHDETSAKGGIAAIKEGKPGRTPPIQELRLDHDASHAMELSTTAGDAALQGRRCRSSEGEILGRGEVGDGVGENEGKVVGAPEGEGDGAAEKVGLNEGSGLADGGEVGGVLGRAEGKLVGTDVGTRVGIGDGVGSTDGKEVGTNEGAETDGMPLGNAVGETDGFPVGIVGTKVSVGVVVGNTHKASSMEASAPDTTSRPPV